MADTPNPIQIHKHLGGVNYPASREDLIEKAKSEGADQSICDALEALPDQQFSGPTDVSEALDR